MLGAVGTSLFGLKAKNLQSADRKKRIVVARDEQGPVELENVSKRWWNHRNHAHEVKDKIVENLKTVNGFAGAGLGTTDTTIGGKRKFKVDVKVENSSINLGIPSSVEGVPVDTTVVKEGKRLGCHNDGPYSTMKGGVICQEKPDTSNYTTTGPMVKRNGTRYLLTCWHMYDNNLDKHCANADGDPFYHQGTQYGNVVDSDHLNDWALVDVDPSNMTSGILTSHDNSVHEISAWFTESGIDSANSDGRRFHRQGVTMGLESGYIGNTDVDNIGPQDCINPDYCITYAIDGADGDSGGPIFAWGNNEPDKAVLAGWLSWGNGVKDTTWGCNGTSVGIYEQTYGPLMHSVYQNRGISLVTY
jgi:hypothetical protein